MSGVGKALARPGTQGSDIAHFFHKLSSVTSFHDNLVHLVASLSVKQQNFNLNNLGIDLGDRRIKYKVN